MARAEQLGYTYIAPMSHVDDFEAAWTSGTFLSDRVKTPVATADSTPSQHVSILTQLIEITKETPFDRTNAAELLGLAVRLATGRSFVREKEVFGDIKLGDIIRKHPFNVHASDGFEPLPMLIVHVHEPGSFEATSISDYETSSESFSPSGTIGINEIRAKLGHADTDRVVNMFRNSAHPKSDPKKVSRRSEKFRLEWEQAIAQPYN